METGGINGRERPIERCNMEKLYTVVTIAVLAGMAAAVCVPLILA